VHGKPLVYLDSGASAQKPRAVLDAMSEFAKTDYANVHRGVHYLSGAATDAYEESRRTVQRFLNAAHEDEIVFTKGGTEAINLVSYSWLAPRIQPGDEIVLSVMEHHSNIVPWHFLRERQGAVLRWVDVADDGSLDIEALAAAIGPKTKLVAITHMSNVLGTMTPLKEIVALAHARGVPVLADGCQGAVHEIVDVRDLDIDFYALTGHKLYGPTGIGALYGKRAHLKAMRPFNGGGEMIREVTREKITYADPPARFEAGTPPIIEAVGLAAAIDYLSQFDRAAIRAHEHDLYTHARRRIGEFNWLRVIGDAPGKGAILSFEADGIHAHDLATILDREGVAVRAGHHCAQILMERFGVASTSRASFALYNTRAEVDALAAALQKARDILG
jgi:cysteine desulfurase/selenocysteine lyase